MSKKYIDADVLMEYLEEQDKKYTDGLTVREVNLLIKNYPAADVEPVKHSQWEYGENLGGEYMRCCDCGITLRTIVPTTYKWCPHCGAKMDGGSE